MRGHLRVPKILSFKKRQSAKLFFWKWVLICTRSNLDPELFCACRGERSRAHSQTREHWGRECTRRKNHFCVDAFALSLALKQRLGSTLKWPIHVSQALLPVIKLCINSYLEKRYWALGHPASRTFLSLARFWRIRERLCMNRVSSLLSMRCMLLGYNFKPRLGTAGSVMNIGSSINGCSHTKPSLTRENKGWLPFDRKFR